MVRYKLAAAKGPMAYYSLAAVPDLEAVEGAVESWIQVLKVGNFFDWRYGDFSVSTEDMDQMIHNFTARAQGVPVDYDHSFSEGQGSRAAGWVQELERRSEELWARVAWTQAGAESIQSGEYRFFSPEFSFNHLNEAGESIGSCMLAGGLTNRPFLEGMAEVSLAVARDGTVLLRRSGQTPSKEESRVDPKQLRIALGLPETATDEEVLKKSAELYTLAQPRPDVVVLSKAEADQQKADAEKGREAQETLRLSQRDALIDEASKDGRLEPVLADHIKTLYDRDPEGTKALLLAMPKKVNLGAPVGGGAVLDVNPGGGGDEGEPVHDRVHSTALALMQAKPNLSYEEAALQADSEVRGRKAVA